jgi:hypothetical protein
MLFIAESYKPLAEHAQTRKEKERGGSRGSAPWDRARCTHWDLVRAIRLAMGGVADLHMPSNK